MQIEMIFTAAKCWQCFSIHHKILITVITFRVLTPIYKVKTLT